MRRSRTIPAVLLIWLSVATAQEEPVAANIAYKDLCGARKLNAETNCIEMAFGWIDPDASGDPSTMVDRLKDTALVASSLGDFVGRIEAPRFGCGDIALTVRHSGPCAINLCRDNGETQQLSMRATAGDAIRTEILDSEEWDTDGDGFWEVGRAKDVDGNVPKGADVVYIAAIPATFFDIPAAVVRTRLAVAVSYFGAKTQLRVAFPLNDDFIVPDKPVRIGLVNQANRVVYVVQKTGAGTIVIGDIADMRRGDRLETPSDGIRIVGARRTTPKPLPQREGFALAQGLGGLPYSRFCAKAVAEFRTYELAKHFDVTELPVSYFNWQYDKWNTDEGRRRRDTAIAHAQAYIDAAHKYGLKIALSHFACAYPGMSLDEMKGAGIDFVGEDIEPNSGRPMKSQDRFHAFDFGSSAAVEWAVGVWRETLGRLRSLDYLFYNEDLLLGGGHRDTRKDWALALFSQGALEDYRNFLGDENAKFPIAKEIPECERTFHTDSEDVWGRYYEWREHVYARFLRAHADAAAQANANNPRYEGAIYFQHKDWQGRPFGIDLMTCLDSPSISWLVCEYATRPDDPQLAHFLDAADKLDKDFSTFINVGYYDPAAPAGCRLNSRQEVKRQFEMGVDLGADGICAYPGEWCDPASDAYDPKMTRLWDALCTNHGFVGKRRTISATPDRDIADAIAVNTKRKTASVLRSPGAITVNGKLDEWDVSAPIIINEKGQAILGADSWEGEKDLGARVYLCCDDESLFIGIDVTDEYVYLRGMGKGKYPVDFDTVDLFVGGFDPVMTAPGGDRKGHAISITGVKDKPQPAIYNHTAREHKLPGGEIAFVPRSSGYTIEMRIPWKSIDGFQPAAGKAFAFDVAIGDVDAAGLAQRHHPRETQMTWNASLPLWNSNGEWGIAEIKP